MRKVRFGIIGAGAIAQVHADAIRLSGNSVLETVYDPAEARAEAFAAKNSCRRAASLEEMLASGIDAVTVATPSGLHRDAAVAAARAGKHILCEKPLEVTLERTDAIIGACEENNVILMPVFQMRFSRASMLVKKALEAGRLGDPVLASASIRWYRAPEYYRNAGWRGTRALDGGGALMNQGIHTVDQLLYFCGPVREVTARCANILHRGIEVEDSAAAMMVFANGGLGTIEASTACAPGFPRRIDISGTRGSISLEDDRIVRWCFDRETPEDEVIRREGAAGEGLHGGSGNPAAITCEGHRRQIAELAECILTGARPAISPRDGRMAVEVICGIYQSAREGRTIEFQRFIKRENPK